MTQPHFDFVAFEAKVAAASRDEYVSGSGGWPRIWIWAMVVGALLAMVPTKLFQPSWAVVTVGGIGLMIEVAGVIGFFIFQLRDVWPMLRNRHVQFARELEVDYVSYVEIVSWLRCFDSANLHAHLTYLRGRRDAMQKRLGLFTGGQQLLGVLPVLAALYIQVREMVWPPHISFLEGLIAFMLILAFSVGWLAVTQKLRLDLYECLLSDALADQTTA